MFDRSEVSLTQGLLVYFHTEMVCICLRVSVCVYARVEGRGKCFNGRGSPMAQVSEALKRLTGPSRGLSMAHKQYSWLMFL